jgi:hypothetical protein
MANQERPSRNVRAKGQKKWETQKIRNVLNYVFQFVMNYVLNSVVNYVLNFIKQFPFFMLSTCCENIFIILLSACCESMTVNWCELLL